MEKKDNYTQRYKRWDFVVKRCTVPPKKHLRLFEEVGEVEQRCYTNFYRVIVFVRIIGI